MNQTSFLEKVENLFKRKIYVASDKTPDISPLFLNSIDRDEIRLDGKLPIVDEKRVVIEIRDKSLYCVNLAGF